MRMVPVVLWGVLFSLTLPVGAAEESSPRRTVARFDSLLQTGSADDMAAAQALTTGQLRRLFPLLAAAQARLVPYLDTARSSDTILEEQLRGSWAALRIRSEAVFTQPFLGLERLESVQAAHLFHDGTDWKIADLEELEDETFPLVLRTGVPSIAGDGGDGSAALLPISRLSPEKQPGGSGRAVTRLRLRVSLRSGDSLPPLPQGPGQRVLARGADWAEVETRLPPVGDSLFLAPWDDTLEVYRASTPDLDLTDKMLQTRAAKLKEGSPHPIETVRRIRRFVSDSFEYRLGATLFGTSREALRDLRGDCSEAAVLTAALLRAAGIPSRVVLGFATLERGVWIGHAWAEAYAGGAWVGVDAALREFPAGAERLALLRLAGDRDMKTQATNLMMGMLANLDIQILEAWGGTRDESDEESLPLVEHPDAQAAAQAFWDQVLEGMGE